MAVTGHTPVRERHHGAASARGRALETNLVVVSVGRSPYTDGLLAEGTGVVGRRTRPHRGRRGLPHRGGRRCGRSVTRSTRRSSPTWASRRRSSPSRTSSARRPHRWTIPGCPWAIYCNPEVAFAGHSEQSAKEAGLDVVTSKHRFAGNSRAMIIGETDGLVKVDRREASRRHAQVGCSVCTWSGPWVTEQLSGGYLAVNWEATVDEVAEFIQPHPSLTELFGETVLSLTGRSLHG